MFKVLIRYKDNCEDANVIVKYLGDSFGHNLIDAADYLDIDCE